jgi:hypothetical protein
MGKADTLSPSNNDFGDQRRRGQTTAGSMVGPRDQGKTRRRIVADGGDLRLSPSESASLLAHPRVTISVLPSSRSARQRLLQKRSSRTSRRLLNECLPAAVQQRRVDRGIGNAHVHDPRCPRTSSVLLSMPSGSTGLRREAASSHVSHTILGLGREFLPNVIFDFHRPGGWHALYAATRWRRPPMFRIRWWQNR